MRPALILMLAILPAQSAFAGGGASGSHSWEWLTQGTKVFFCFMDDRGNLNCAQSFNTGIRNPQIADVTGAFGSKASSAWVRGEDGLWGCSVDSNMANLNCLKAW
jgi:hypothetical protein